MNYVNGRNLVRQNDELKEFVTQRLVEEDEQIQKRIYQWLSNHQYFLDNELFDFYFCVAQNLAAVEVLGGSGQKIIEAGIELQQSAQSCTDEINKNCQHFNRESEKIQNQLSGLNRELDGIKQNQEQLSGSTVELIEKLNIEQKNLEVISRGLITSVNSLLDKQKKLSSAMRRSNSFIHNSLITVIALLGWLAATLMLLSY